MGERGVAIKLEKEGGMTPPVVCLEKRGRGKEAIVEKNQNSVKRMRRGETALVLAEEKEEKEAVAGDDGDRGERGRERQDWERGKWETEEGRPQRGADTLGGDCGGRAAMKRLRWKLESKSKKSFLTLCIFSLGVSP